MHIPWQMMHHTTIRMILKDLGLSRLTSRLNGAQLLVILQDIETDGLEAVVQRLEDRPSQSPPSSRAVSPELGVSRHTHRSQPALRPVVEIPSPPKAGPSRIRPSVHGGAIPSTFRVGPPPPKRRKVAVPRPLAIPPPSYAILYQQKQQIKPPAKDPYPLLRPQERFDGVHLPAPRRARAGSGSQRQTTSRRPVGEDGEGDDDDEGRSTARANGVASTGSRTGFPGKPRTLEAVVVTTSVRAVKTQWKQVSCSDIEMDD